VDTWLEEVIRELARQFPDGTFWSFTFNLQGLLAVFLVSLVSGAVGSLVVGNRMAFFSDALAHCAFAGVGLGLLMGLLAGATTTREFNDWVLPIMLGFGVLVGILIALVREKTALASDTVIGVFFAGAIGFGALVLTALSRRSYFHPENFLFGEPVIVTALELILLFVLTLVTAGMLAWMYNDMVFTSFNSSLARSRRIPVRLYRYLFIILLAGIVNMCLKIVGALLINALLIVPAATAANVCRNMRQLFWVTISLCVVSGVGGMLLQWELAMPDPAGAGEMRFGTSGIIVVCSVILFFLSMLVGPRWKARPLRERAPEPVPEPATPGDA
jgi:zinc transport system permease protein